MLRPLWSRLGPLSLRLARWRPLRGAPVLLVSLPRSGSSWGGEALSLSPAAAYLCEPLTQSRDVRPLGRATVFEIVPEQVPPARQAALERAVTLALAGVPRFPPRVVRSPEQFAYRRRQRRRLVLKEVNLMALPWLVEHLAARDTLARVIYLTRHPAGVAASYHRLGWTEPRLAHSLSDRTWRAHREALAPLRGRFWAEHGAMQALAHRLAHRALKAYEGPSLRVSYEALCRAPQEEFRKLYAFARLPWTPEVARQLRRRSAGPGDHKAPHDTYRDSEAMVEAWRHEVPPEALRELRAAYLRLQPPLYRDDWD